MSTASNDNNDTPSDEGLPVEASVLKEWNVEVKHIQSGGLEGRKEASQAGREEIAALLGVDKIVSFTCDYDFAPYEKRRYVLQCQYKVHLQQKSIYSLDLVDQKIESDFETEIFKRRDDDEGGQFYLGGAGVDLDSTDKDFFNDSVIELGRLVYEFLSLELDNYAQSYGEAEQWSQKNEEERLEQNKKQSPFAILQELPLGKKSDD